MLTKKLLPYMALGITMYLSSCQKDAAFSDDSSLNSETISSDATIDNTIETAAPVWTSVTANINSNVAGYGQGLPALYDKTTKKYPLIVFLHGIGELGTNPTRLNCCGLPYHLSRKTFPANFNVKGQNFSFITIAPQFKVRASPADVQSVIDYAKRRWRIDPSRIYVMGLSLGGGSTWDWSTVYGQNAAAIVPICGGTAPTTSFAQKVATKNLPIWALYSTKDVLVPASWGTNWFNWIKQFNSAIASKIKLTIWTDADHNGTWMRATNPATKIDGYNIYQWALLHTRGGSSVVTPVDPAKPGNTANKPPVAIAGADQTIPVSWKYLRLNALASKDPDGWLKSVRWTQVSGPSSIKFLSPQSGNTLTSGMVAGRYVFRVAVTDNAGAVSYDETTVTFTGSGGGSGTPTPGKPAPVNPVAGNKPPVAIAGADQTIPISWQKLRLNGLASHDTDGWLTSIKWTQVSGPSTIKLLTTTSGNTLTSGMVVGKYVFRVAVTDNVGAVSYDETTITFTNN